MNRDEKFKNSVDTIYYKIINSLKKGLDAIPTVKSKEKKIVLNRNAIVKNRYKGKRCFIVANGPSINNENLELLKGEYIFTVNQMIRKPEFADLLPIVNIWADPAYFDSCMPANNVEEFCNLFKKTSDCNDRILNFAPLYSRTFMEKQGLLTERVMFFDSSLYFHDNYIDEFDYTKRIPIFQNIVQYASSLAIYMGFNEIYLLGCDSTGIVTKINSVLEESIEKCYTYELGSTGQNYVNSLLNYFTVEEQFAGWARIFHIYNQFNDYCVQKGVKYINCTSTTIIQGIPRMRLEDVFK